jgi:hypothetical protein
VLRLMLDRSLGRSLSSVYSKMRLRSSLKSLEQEGSFRSQIAHWSFQRLKPLFAMRSSKLVVVREIAMLTIEWRDVLRVVE